MEPRTAQVPRLLSQPQDCVHRVERDATERGKPRAQRYRQELQPKRILLPRVPQPQDGQPLQLIYPRRDPRLTWAHSQGHTALCVAAVVFSGLSPPRFLSLLSGAPQLLGEPAQDNEHGDWGRYTANKTNRTEISYKDKISDVDTNPLLNPEKGKIIGYKEKDITNLSNYSKQITKDNLNKDKIIEQNEIKIESKQKEINRLNTEIKKLKSGKTIKEKDKIIENQKLIIKEKDETINFQNTIISSLRNELTELKENIDTIINSVKNVAIDLYKALKRTLGFDVDKNQEYDLYSFKSLSKKINKKYEKDKSDDYEL